MACKKSELISAINSFASARVSGDPNLIAFAVKLISDLVDTIDFALEEEEVTNDDQPE
jgi:hypothetical protein